MPPPSSSSYSPLSYLLFLSLLLLYTRPGEAGRRGREGDEKEERQNNHISYSSYLMSSSDSPGNTSPSALTDDEDRVLVCYHGSWAVYRPGSSKFVVEDIDPFLCTHLVYAFAGLQPDTLTVTSLDPYNDLYDNYGKGGYKRFTGLKKVNPDLKTLLGLGGWTQGSRKYSQMVSSNGTRSTFINSCVDFLHKYGFDGLDIDWEYPTLRGGRPQDKVNFGQLLKEMRSEFDQHGFLLTAGVSAGKLTIDAAYDVQAMASSLDLVNLMGYDLHGPWDHYAHHHEPLYAYTKDAGPALRLNVDYAVRYWLHLGLPAKKLVMGVGAYGRCFTLASPAHHDPYAPAPQPGSPAERGYNTICEAVGGGGWTVVRDRNMVSPYMYSGRQWCGYDDPISAAVKARYIKQHGLAGAMVWSLDTEDFHGSCSSPKDEVGGGGRRAEEEEEEGGGVVEDVEESAGREGGGVRFPITTTIRTILRDGKPIPTPTPAPIPTPTTTIEPNVTTTDIPTTTTSPGPTPDPTFICHHEGFNADPRGDCMVFYECHQEAGRWRVWKFHCPPGTVFVEDLQNCDFPENHPACLLLPTLSPLPTLPPSTLPPTTFPPSTLPPTTFPPSTLPPTTFPPSTLPPTTFPPTTLPPSSLPPSTPDNLPENNFFTPEPYPSSSSLSHTHPHSHLASPSSTSPPMPSSFFSSPFFSPYPSSTFPYSSSSVRPISNRWDTKKKRKWMNTNREMNERRLRTEMNSI